MHTIDDVKNDIKRQDETYGSGEFDSYFKYCSHRVVKSIFLDKLIRFTQPRALNDPLEFNPTLRFKNSRTMLQTYDFNGIELPSVELFYRIQIIEAQINEYGILSLTKIPNSFDMWSQYADGHKGFIIELKSDFWKHNCMKSSTGNEYPVKKVEYVEDYALYLEDIVNENNEIPVKEINKLFFQKTSRWSNEFEYRMVRPLSDSPDYKPRATKYKYSYTDYNIYRFPFELQCISSVVLGAYMSVEDKMIISKYCEEYNIPFSQAIIVRDSYDHYGKPSTVYITPINQFYSKELILQAKPQLFSTDTIKLSNQTLFKIDEINKLPYYKGHEEVVDLLLNGLEKNTNNNRH